MRRIVSAPCSAAPSLLALLLFAVVPAGCGNDEARLEPADDGTTPVKPAKDDDKDEPDASASVAETAAPSPTTTASAKPEWTCKAPEFPQEDDLQAFEALTAQVVDQDGEAVAGTTAQVCGLNICLYGETDDAGFIQNTQATELRRAAFKYGDGLHYAQFARLLGEATTYELGEQTTVSLGDLAKAPELKSGEVLEAGGATLDLTTSQFQLDLLSFPDDSDHVFLASELVPKLWPEAVPQDEGLEMLFALGPLKTKFCPPAVLHLPNSPNWAAGAKLEVLLHIVDTANHWGAYGTFAVVAKATVDEDGKGITTDPDAGLPELGVIALRLAP